jgi:hypothetical protein
VKIRRGDSTADDHPTARPGRAARSTVLLADLDLLEVTLPFGSMLAEQQPLRDRSASHTIVTVLTIE